MDPSLASWEYVRDVSDDTAEQWLAVFQRDEPNAVFKLSSSRPKIGGKKHKIMRGPGSTY